MENELAELRKAVEELAEEEGISFPDALEVSIKALRLESKRRKQHGRGLVGGDSGCGIKE